MPILTLPITADGPIVQVLVGISWPRRKAMKAANLAVPNPEVGRFLIDTGATSTCIDPRIIQSLGIPPSGSISIQTPSTNSTPHQCSLFDVSLGMAMPGNAIHVFATTLPVVECQLTSQGIDGLLGRDILDKCLLTYNGAGKLFILAT
ncbi:MAG: retropepsin-like aspartic protease [Planctomycetales bacterium]